MLKIYFDDVLIDEDSYTGLSNDYQLFTDSFKLGSVASDSFKLSVNKTMVSIHPSEVKIEDDNTTFFLVVDSIEEDNYVYSYTLTDKLVNFNFNYDASSIINEKAELEETCYLSDIWHDMCNQASVEYDDEYEFINDIETEWYDNTIQARKYLSYIAELQGGYACILPNGKQSFKPYKKASSKTIDIDTCSDFILGEKKTITRVVYDNGVNFWEFGDTTGSTVYLDPANVFIINEEQIETIYDLIVGFEFYLVDVPQCPIDSTVRAGDVITFTDGINNYPTIAQYSTSYFGNWVGGYKLEVKTDKQEETKILGQKEIIKKIQTEIDRANASLKITAEQTDENSSSISILEQNVDVISLKTQKIDEVEQRVSNVEATVDGLVVDVSKSGGTNLISNSVGYYGYDDWTDAHEGYTNTEIQQNTVSKNAWLLKNKTAKQISMVQNGIYTFSYKYKKLLGPASTKIVVNGFELTLNSMEWQTNEYVFEVLSNQIEIQLISDSDDACYLSDLMLNSGNISSVWTSANGESIKGGVRIGNNIEITSSTSNIKQTMGNDGNRIINATTNEIKTEFTDKGTKTDELEAKKALISKLLIVDTGNQTWISRM